MYNLKRRRESVATVYKKTTKFLTINTVNLLKKMPNTKKYCLLAKIVDECQENERRNKFEDRRSEEDSNSDNGDRELDYYLGVRKKETYWRDPIGKEQIRKDYLLYHCGVSEEDYEKFYKKTIAKPSHVIQPRFKQVPFKIHKKRDKKAHSLREGVAESWCEKRGIFKIFGNKRESDSTSDSYSECDSADEETVRDISKQFNRLKMFDSYDDLLLEGARIKEVSEGRPCDNCPELCPGFISHPWSVCTLQFIMCLSLKQLEWAEICRRIRNKDSTLTEKKIQKFPSRERNYAVRRKYNNNSMRSHVNCEACARVAEEER
ncbi:unnamed protein product [Colias eurytheme]|nr:unnamed protein product [Colias eurytheme]